MKIAYFSVNPVNRNSGVPSKLAYQMDGWRLAGHEVTLFCATDESDISERMVEGEFVYRPRQKNPLSQIFSDNKVLDQLADKVRAWKPDFVYMRWGYHRRVYCELADEFPTAAELNGNVIQTAYSSKLRSRSKLSSMLLGPYSQFTIDWLLSRVRGIVGITKEVTDLDYVQRQGKPTFVAPNPIDLGHYETLPPTDPKDTIPRVVFIGNVAPWQGLDKLPELARRAEGRLLIDVVGCECPWVVCPPNVAFHGFLKKEGFLEVFRKCDAGLDGLALHVRGMNQSSNLKIREYLASGLPIVLAGEDGAFLDVKEKPEWILQIGNDPQNVSRSVEAIVDFAARMKGRRVAHEEVAPYIDSRIIEPKRAAFMESLLDKR
ncbi:MAG: hypothetical protein AAGJ79_07380 [Verrucomicrobiota bacterium]